MKKQFLVENVEACPLPTLLAISNFIVLAQWCRASDPYSYRIAMSIIEREGKKGK